MPRLIFANQLRGIAALCVVGSHMVGVFWAMREFVGIATVSPPQPGDFPPIFGFFSHTWLNFGPLGVGIFFLISGLVIPLSLAQHSRRSFLVARLLRIYPTYLVALLLEIAMLHAASAYWDRPFPYQIWSIVSNALLIYNAVGEPPIDLVNWTLCIELKFYLLMLLVAPQIRRGSLTTVLAIGCSICAAEFALNEPRLAVWIGLPHLVESVGTEAVFVVLMLIGVLFNFRLRGLLSMTRFAASVTVMLALFLAAWTHSPIRAQFPIVTANYLYDVAIFAALFFLRDFARPIALIDFFARISYPLYLIHSLVGFSVLKVLMLSLGMRYMPALGIAFVMVVLLATLLHFTVEAKTTSIGKRLARRVPDTATRLPLADLLAR